MNLRRAISLYAITHREYMKSNFTEAVKQCIDGGVTMLQIREKNLDQERFVQEVMSIKEFCKERGVPIIINDNLDVLEKTDADGIHIGQNDEKLVNVKARFKDKIIGVTATTIEEAIEAEKNGADYIGVGPPFKSRIKYDASVMPIETLKEITKAVNIPVCAVGGINSETIKQLKHTGIDGVAVVSAIFGKEDVKKASQELKTAVCNVTSKNVLTVAGSDPTGGAGFQADLKTFAAHKKYGMTVITAVIAQNTMSVDYIEEVSKHGVEAQFKSVFDDIVPDAVKIGMVSNIEIIKAISESLKKYNAKNIVMDPVMVSTSGFKLLNDNAIEALKENLFPLARVITPNVPEAEILSEMTIKNEEDMIKAAEKIGREGNFSVLIKGGHLVNDAVDILYENGTVIRIAEERVETKNTHGTGCTLSSAIACNLADAYSLEESIRRAKKYLVDAMKNDLDLGHGSGPLNHVYNVELF